MNEVSRPYEVVQVSTGRLEIPRLVEVRLLDLRWTGCNDVLDGHHRIFGRAGLRHRGKILLQRRQPAALNLVEVGSAGVGVLGHGRAVIVRDGLLNMAHGLELLCLMMTKFDMADLLSSWPSRDRFWRLVQNRGYKQDTH